VDALRTELFSGTVAVWALLEVSLRVRDRARGMGGADRDAGTRVLIAAAIGGAVVSSVEAPVIVPSLSILLRRISVEEAELTRVLGDRYKSYRSGTKRLIPGVW
jgi:protein-S-isoprenylcysteine O-methyltransferase Ste14